MGGWVEEEGLLRRNTQNPKNHLPPAASSGREVETGGGEGGGASLPAGERCRVSSEIPGWGRPQQRKDRPTVTDDSDSRNVKK